MILFFVAHTTAQRTTGPVTPDFSEPDLSRSCDPSTDLCIQGLCDDIPRPRISTHPDRSVNRFNPSRSNFFDWRDDSYPVLLAPNSLIQNPLPSPFTQGGNTNTHHFISLNKRDMRPEDGWELLKYDFGGRLSAEHINTNIVTVPYLILYNRFLGKMRVFVARGNESYTTNFAVIQAILLGENYSSLLDLHQGALTALDAPFQKGAIQVPANVLNNPGKCSYAEFPVIYDPCTCEYGDNSLAIRVSNVDTTSISLSGTIEGTLVSRSTNGVQSNISEDAFSFKDIQKKISNTYVKMYSTANKFIDDSKKIIDNTFGVGTNEINILHKKEALNKLGNDLNMQNWFMNTLRSGFHTMPHVTAALSLFDLFTVGGTSSSAPQKVQIMPMALSANVKLQGNLFRSTSYIDITMATPGSNTTNSAVNDYPYYNETLGVFNLLETPKVSRNLDNRMNGDREQDYDSYLFSYKLASPVKYVINPASGLEVQEVQAALVMRDMSAATSLEFNNFISAGMATTKHVNLFTDAPQGTLTTIRMSETQSEIFDNNKIWLQLILNLRRKDGNGTNVLLVVTYPTMFVQGTEKCANCIEQVSQPEIRQFCTDANSVYRQNRILAKQKPVETVMQPTIQHFKAFPNPVDNQLHLSYDSETEQTVKAWLTDVTGRMVSDVATQKVGKGNYNLDLPTQTLPEGLHLLIFEANGIQKVQKVVIRH